MICSVDAIFSGFAYFLPKTAENKLNDCPLSWPFRHRKTGVSYSQDPSIAIFPLLSGIEALCFPPSFVSPTRTIRQRTAGRTRSKRMRGASTRASSRGRRRWVSEETFRIKKRSFGFRAISCSKGSRIEGHFFTAFNNAKAPQAIQRAFNVSITNKIVTPPYLREELKNA